MRAEISTRHVTTAMRNIRGNKASTPKYQIPNPRGFGFRFLEIRTRLGSWKLEVGSFLFIVLVLLFSAGLEAHGVSGKDAVFLQGLKGRAIGPLLYLGAK